MKSLRFAIVGRELGDERAREAASGTESSIDGSIPSAYWNF
jgi:hypothetical protein